MNSKNDKTLKTRMVRHYLFSALELLFFGIALFFLLPNIPSDVNYQQTNPRSFIFAFIAFVFSQIFSFWKKQETIKTERFLRIIIFATYIYVLYSVQQYL
jgi:uncharacterized protein YqhQ